MGAQIAPIIVATVDIHSAGQSARTRFSKIKWRAPTKRQVNFDPLRRRTLAKASGPCCRTDPRRDRQPCPDVRRLRKSHFLQPVPREFSHLNLTLFVKDNGPDLTTATAERLTRHKVNQNLNQNCRFMSNSRAHEGVFPVYP
jgi:hypothetical protein